MTRAPPEASEARGGAEVGLTGRVLVSPAGLLVERPGQALEVCVEGDEARALEEGAPARLVGDAVERAPAEARADGVSQLDARAGGRDAVRPDGDAHGAARRREVAGEGLAHLQRACANVGD